MSQDLTRRTKVLAPAGVLLALLLAALDQTIVGTSEQLAELRRLSLRLVQKATRTKTTSAGVSVA